jgi:hypothetical protein
LIWYGIQGNPYIKSEDKPKRRDAIFKLTLDKEEGERRKPDKITAEDLKIFEQMQYSKK